MKKLIIVLLALAQLAVAFIFAFNTILASKTTDVVIFNGFIAIASFFEFCIICSFKFETGPKALKDISRYFILAFVFTIIYYFIQYYSDYIFIAMIYLRIVLAAQLFIAVLFSGIGNIFENDKKTGFSFVIVYSLFAAACFIIRKFISYSLELYSLYSILTILGYLFVVIAVATLFLFIISKAHQTKLEMKYNLKTSEYRLKRSRETEVNYNNKYGYTDNQNTNNETPKASYSEEKQGEQLKPVKVNNQVKTEDDDVEFEEV